MKSAWKPKAKSASAVSRVSPDLWDRIVFILCFLQMSKISFNSKREPFWFGFIIRAFIDLFFIAFLTLEICVAVKSSPVIRCFKECFIFLNPWKSSS